MTRVLIGRPCHDCGRKIRGRGRRCSRCGPRHEARRQARQPYRQAYFSPEYRAARAQRMKLAGGRCEAIVGRARCRRPAEETHHVIPLSQAASLEEAIALCTVENLRAACFRHNPRGGRR